MGLMGAGVAAYVVESSRIDRRIDQAIVQEIDEFSEFAQEGVDPATGRSFDPVSRLLKTAMQRNVPDEHEALLAFWNGGPQIVHPGRGVVDRVPLSGLWTASVLTRGPGVVAVIGVSPRCGRRPSAWDGAPTGPDMVSTGRSALRAGRSTREGDSDDTLATFDSGFDGLANSVAGC